MSRILGLKRSHDPEEQSSTGTLGWRNGVAFVTTKKACNHSVLQTHASYPRPGRAGVDVLQAPRTDATSDKLPHDSASFGEHGIGGRAFGASQSTHEQRVVPALPGAMVQRTKVTSSDLLTASSRRALFDSLIREAHVMTLLRRGKVIPCIPVTPCRNHILDLLPLPVCASLETELVECIGCEVLGLCVVIAAHLKR